MAGELRPASEMQTVRMRNPRAHECPAGGASASRQGRVRALHSEVLPPGRGLGLLPIHCHPSLDKLSAHNERNVVPLEPASPRWLKTCTYMKSRFKGGHLPLKSQSQKKPFPAGRARMSLLALMPKKGGLWGTGVPWPWMQRPPGWDLPQTGCFWGTSVTPNLCHVS